MRNICGFGICVFRVGAIERRGAMSIIAEDVGLTDFLF